MKNDVLVQWLEAFEAAESNPQLLLEDYEKNRSLCIQRMTNLAKAEKEMLAMEDKPPEVTRYVAAMSAAHQHTCCLFRSSPPIHDECAVVIKEFFDSRRALVEAIKA